MFQLELTSPLFLVFATLFAGFARYTRAKPRWFEWMICASNFIFLFLISYYIQNIILIVGVAIVVILLGEMRLSRFSESNSFALVIILGLWCLLFIMKDSEVFLAPFKKTAIAEQLISIVGISYFIFRCISYFSDVELIEQRSFIKSLNYLLFFPTVLAGPIIRYDDYVAQHKKHDSVLSAFHQIANGFIKKFILAELLTPAGIFSKGSEHWSTPMLWVAIPLQLLILFFDFSGYCDIMIGLGRLAGFQIPANFNSPFSSTNIQEFWTRWHITLGTFIKDYVFNPVYRMLLQRFTTYDAYLLSIGVYFFTMLLIALWHKVSWGFLIFGLIHATALVLYLLKKRYFPVKNQHIIRRILAQVSTYLLVSFSMVFWYYGPIEALAIIRQMVYV